VDRRQLSLFDVLCLGVNAIVGSGIYAFPGLLASSLGPASFLAFGLCGLIAAIIGLCFAEASGMFERSGGPYLYARAAFGGPLVGDLLAYAIGWTCWAAAVLSWAAVARAIPPYLGQLWAPLGSSLAGPSAVLISLLLGAINLLGVRPGAITTDLLTLAKLAPLAILVGAALFVGPRWPAGPIAPAGLGPLPAAAFTAFFAFQGFEVVPVPAGETAHPRRNAPIAVLTSLLVATLLYMLVQWTAVASTPTVAGSSQPLAEMGRSLLGSVGARLVSSAAVISMLGFCAGVALAGPRYLEPLAADGFLPPALASRHPRWQTPYLAIIITTCVTALLILLLDFARLVNLSVLTVSAQYLATCLAVPLLRWRRPDQPRSFRLPAGPLLPLAGLVVTVWLGLQAKRAELVGIAVLVVVGLTLGGIYRLATSRRQRPSS
jgi:basic amino acid/polyamine antiporter, APA family